MFRWSFVALLLLLTMCDGADLSGAWIQKDIKWVDVPADIAAHEKVGNGGILHFQDDGSFALIYCTIGRRSKEYKISGGDPREVHRGTWKRKGGQFAVTYRLVEKTIRAVGENLQGAITDATIEVRQRRPVTLIFEKKAFVRRPELDKSAAEAALLAR